MRPLVDRSRVRVAPCFPAVVALLTVACCSLPPGAPGVDEQAARPGSVAESEMQYATTAQVLDAVLAAQEVYQLPKPVAATLTANDQAAPKKRFDCIAVDNPTNAHAYGECAFGDPTSEKLMVVYGDSRADMWAATLEQVARLGGWQLRVFAQHACPGPDLQFMSMETMSPNSECDVFHRNAPGAVKALEPDLVLVTSMKDWLLADGSAASAEEWQDGWISTIRKLVRPGTDLVMLGDIAQWNNNGPRCLAAHIDSVQDCSVPAAEANWGHSPAEQAAAATFGALYVPTTPWFCAQRCEPVIADIRVFNDESHITQTYALYLVGAMKEALRTVMA